jgi:hypothetical protein
VALARHRLRRPAAAVGPARLSRGQPSATRRASSGARARPGGGGGLERLRGEVGGGRPGDQCGLLLLGAGGRHPDAVAGRGGRPEQAGGQLGVAPPRGHPGEPDQHQGRRGRLGGGEREAGRLAQVGLGGLELAEARLGAAELAQGATRPISLLTWAVPRRRPVRRARVAASACSSSARASSPARAARLPSSTRDEQTTQVGPAGRAAFRASWYLPAASSSRPPKRAAMPRTNSRWARPRWSPTAWNPSRASSARANARAGSPK